LKKLAFLLLIFGITSSGASAQDTADEFSLRRVVAMVLRRNPDVTAAEKAYSAARARLLTRRALLADPVFVAEYDGLSRLRPGFAGYGERVLGIGQQIELPVKWWMRNEIAGKETRVAEMGFEFVKLEMIAEARKAYGWVLAAEKERALAADNLTLAQEFLERARVRFDVGDVPRIEVLRAEIEVANAELDTLQAGKTLLLAEADLNLLMARDAHAPLSLTDELTFAPVEVDMGWLKALMMERHPEARALSYAVAGDRSAVRLSALNFLPDLELGVSRQRVRGEGSFWVAQIGFEMPLWFMFRQRGELQEAKANLAQAQAEQVSVRNRLVLQLENAYHQLHVAEKQVRMYQEQLLEEAAEVYRIASRSYEEGEASYLEVLEAQRTLRTTRTGYVQALFEYESALADLERTVGGELIPAGQ
jgi:cobalt-zinc-cadmium efflux system outer membrane protein